MQHADQHNEAIAKTLRKLTEVSAGVFDDKVKQMGTVTVRDGTITVKLDYFPGAISGEASRDFLIDAIGLAIKACFDAKPDAFRNYN